MSSLYNKYLIFKKKNNLKFYLFKSGNFYIFLDEDAIRICDITTLKLTNLNDDIKTGSNEDVIKKLKNINIDSITPLNALNMLKKLKDMIDV